MRSFKVNVIIFVDFCIYGWVILLLLGMFLFVGVNIGYLVNLGGIWVYFGFRRDVVGGKMFFLK